MDRELNQARRWLDTAVKGIRFGPDRRAARAELAAHMEDKAADLRRIFPDMTAQEAEERALSEMGDPAEVGKALAKIHRPWLGWLWRASQGALAVMLLLLALAGANVILGSIVEISRVRFLKISTIRQECSLVYRRSASGIRWKPGRPSMHLR